MSKKDILIEVCCGSVEGAFEAEKGGADRVELNSSLFFGGLTPSIGAVIEAKKRLNIPVIVMIRPRGGGFCYTEIEFAAMLEDARLAIEHGADGLVFGILTEDGAIDQKRNAELVRITGDREAVFHRAFDVVPDPFKAIDQLVELGVKRILTTGQQDRVDYGLDLLKRLNDYSGGRIAILPGSINKYNIRTILEKTGCREIHMASFINKTDRSATHGQEIHYGASLYPPEDSYRIIDRNAVAEINKILS